MGKRLQSKVKKLALAYQTGWEYMPGDEEPGSVVTDIFLDMAEDNRQRYSRIWQKQEQVFQGAVPESEKSAGEFAGELAVKVSPEEHGKWLEKGSQAYMETGQGAQICVRTVSPLQLTSAKLQYAIYRKGLCAWLAWEAGQGQDSLALFRQSGKELAHPLFRWYFRGLFDGRADFCFEVKFHRKALPAGALGGKWTVSDGEAVFPAAWKQTEQGYFLEGRTPGFAGNLEGQTYEVRLAVPSEEALSEEWAETLCGGYGLRVGAEEREPGLCITDTAVEGAGQILPFGVSLEEACCCYLSCDRIMAGAEGEILLRFREIFLREERLPEPHSREYEKLYKKYPWLGQSETVREWQAEDTFWEYFDGNRWRILPGSDGWKTGCPGRGQGERSFSWRRPRDMKPCVVEGEEHFYIRLRLARVQNAYALYYRKSIPVLEGIRFWAKERLALPERQKIPRPGEMKGESMFLGFDREVTPDNRWYTGAGSRSFTREEIRGTGVRFGREAFWVEPAGKEPENLACFCPNYVPLRMAPEEGVPGHAEWQIRKGDIFHLEPANMGVLEAECLSDICCAGAGVPVVSARQAAEHRFAHFGRMLTLWDMELMLQERYPLLRVRACVFRREAGRLEVELACLDGLNDSVREQWEREYRDNWHVRLTEIRDWLEETLSRSGPVWLQKCSVRCSFPDRGNGENGTSHGR